MASADLSMASHTAWQRKHAETFEHFVPSRLTHIAATISSLVRNGLWKNLAYMSWEALFGTASLIVLRLDLSSFRSEPLRRFSLTARPIQPKDVPVFCSPRNPTLSTSEQREDVRRLSMLRAGIKTCYVVEDSKGNARFLQWLIPSSQNSNIQRTFGKWYPIIAPDEAMIEHVYVLPKYRGTGLLPRAVAAVLEIARAQGVRHIVTFIPTWNKNSMKSFMRLGFRPCEHRFDQKILGFRFRRTVPLPPFSQFQQGPPPVNRPQMPTAWQILRISVHRARLASVRDKGIRKADAAELDKISSH